MYAGENLVIDAKGAKLKAHERQDEEKCKLIIIAILSATFSTCIYR